MSSWLKNRKQDNEGATHPRSDVEAMLPPSVRPPDSNRFTALASDSTQDADDEDLEFLTAIANEVDRAAAAPAAIAASPKAVMPLRGASSRIDDMEVFRELKDDDKNVLRYNHNLRDVDMGDLLEELSDVQAALRQRKVA